MTRVKTHKHAPVAAFRVILEVSRLQPYQHHAAYQQQRA